MSTRSRTKWYAVLAIGVTFALGGAWMVGSRAEHGWSVLLFFALCAAVSIAQLWPGVFMPRAKSPQRLLQRFPGPVELSVSRIKFLYLMVGAAIFGGVGLDMLGIEPVGWFEAIMLWLGVAACAAAIPFMIVLTVRGSSLRLDREGLTISHGWRRQFLSWAHASAFEVSTLPTPAEEKKCVVYNDATSNGTMATINTAITGCNAALPDTYGLSHDELTWLLNQWRNRALGDRR